MALDNITVRVACSGSLSGGEQWANIWHVRSRDADAGTISLGDGTLDAIGILFTQFYEDLLAYLSAGWTLDSVVVSQLDDPGNVFSRVEAEVGSSVSDPLPNQNAIVVSMRASSPVNPRRGLGRVFLAGWAENATAAGAPRLLAAARTTLVTAVSTLSDALQAVPAPAGPFDLAVYSRIDDLARPLISAKVGNVFDTQRRRRQRLSEQYSSVTL